jgi:hypothetical protein
MNHRRVTPFALLTPLVATLHLTWATSPLPGPAPGGSCV